MNGLFVTATDTGVGKTWVACALARAAVRRGLRVAVMKPCETGDGDDGARLLDAVGRALDPALVRPYQLPPAGLARGRRRAPKAPSSTSAASPTPSRVSRETPTSPSSKAPAACSCRSRPACSWPTSPLASACRSSSSRAPRSAPSTTRCSPLEAARARSPAPSPASSSAAPSTAAGPEEPTNPDAIATYGRVPILGLFPHGRDADAVADRVLDQLQPRAR